MMSDITVLMFQSTPLREGRRLLGIEGPESKVFQSTPLREGRRGSPEAWAPC